MTQGQFLNVVKLVWIHFSLSQTGYLTKTKERCLPFLLAMAWSETQTTSSRIWTQVTTSISYDSNRYTERVS